MKTKQVLYSSWKFLNVFNTIALCFTANQVTMQSQKQFEKALKEDECNDPTSTYEEIRLKAFHENDYWQRMAEVGGSS